MARSLAEIPADQGLNWLLRQAGVEVREIAIDDPSVLFDLDTPEDYERLVRSVNRDLY